jgi:hypothetical protein
MIDFTVKSEMRLQLRCKIKQIMLFQLTLRALENVSSGSSKSLTVTPLRSSLFSCQRTLFPLRENALINEV